MQRFVPAIVPILFLAGAFLPIWPYSFFVILRWVITGSCAYILCSRLAPNYLNYVLFGALLLFNPIFPVHLSRATWLVIDALTIVPFVIVIGNNLRNNSSKTTGAI